MADRQSRIGAVVLAAGASVRFGSAKQLAVVNGVPLVRRAAEAALGAGARPVVVVLGASAKSIAPVLDGLSEVTSVVNDEWSTGMASSLVSGLRALRNEPHLDGVLVTLADQPAVDADSLRTLISAFDDTNRIVAAAYSGTFGVPALFGREHIESLLTLHGDNGAGFWLRDRSSKVTCVSLDVAAFDLDTPHDMTRLVHGGLLFAPPSRNA